MDGAAALPIGINCAGRSGELKPCGIGRERSCFLSEALAANARLIRKA